MPIWDNIGRSITIDDPIFSQANCRMGLWKPLEFLKTAEGGLFFLETFKDNKVPVIFIHGAMGGPADFREMIESLDNRYFQPWVAFYPSGIRLDHIGGYLVQAITKLQHKYRFKRFMVVAHSMGMAAAGSLLSCIFLC